MPYSQLVDAVGSSVHTSGLRKNEIHRITVHCYVGNATVEEMVANFRQNSRGASCNYAIAKDGKIAVILGEEYRSYCSSSHENDEQAITIECACSPSYPYTFPEATYRRLVELCADICSRNGKKKLLWIENKTKRLSYQPAEDEMVLTMHRDFFDTACPGQWMVEHEADLAQKVTAALNEAHAIFAEEREPEEDHEPAETIPTGPAGEPLIDPTATATAGYQGRDLAKMGIDNALKILGPILREEQKKYGLLASVMLAQAIAESGLNSDLFQHANAMFSMKTFVSGNNWAGSVWDGASAYKKTWTEWKGGKQYQCTDYYRAYPDLEHCIEDHRAYLLNAKKDDGTLRYAGLAGCTDAEKAVEIIVNGGYCTEPNYADALLHYLETYALGQWDYGAQDEQQEKQIEQQTKPLFPDTQSNDTVTIPVSDWNAIKAAIVVAYQAVRKHDDVG